MAADRFPSDASPEALAEPDLRRAYEQGRRDERRERKRRPVFMTLLFVCAAVGVVLLVLAAVNGSFGTAGGVVDENLSVAADRAEPVVRDAASEAGQSLREAGQSVKERAADDPAR